MPFDYFEKEFTSKVGMMSKPVISVLVPTHNHGHYLARCLRSLLSQSESRREYEIIVIDDGSTDKTSSVIEDFSTLVVHIRNDENIGLPGSLNKGIEAAKGDFFVRVDSDDFVNRYFLSCLRVYLELNNDADAVACDYFLVDDAENIVSREDAAANPIGCGIMFRGQSVRELGGYNDSFRVHEDKEFRNRFDKRYSLQRLSIPLYRYRRHEGNLTNNDRLMQKYEKILLESTEGD